MTRELKDNKYFTTPFSNWLREREEVSSKAGYVTSDIDFIWTNYKNNKFMMLEEKCRMSEMNFAQEKLLMRMHKLFKADKDYCGFYLLQFENESPDDGEIYITNKQTDVKKLISKEELVSFLRDFKLEDDKIIDEEFYSLFE